MMLTRATVIYRCLDSSMHSGSIMLTFSEGPINVSKAHLGCVWPDWCFSKTPNARQY